MHLCRKCIYGADKNDQILFSTYGKSGRYIHHHFFCFSLPRFPCFFSLSIPPEKEEEEWRQLLAPKQKEEEKSFWKEEQWPPLSRKRETQQQQKYLSTPNDRRHQRGKTRRAKKLLTGLTKRKGISYSFLKLHAWHKTCIKACFCSSSIPRFFSYPFENATRDPSFSFPLFS